MDTALMGTILLDTVDTTDLEATAFGTKTI